MDAGTPSSLATDFGEGDEGIEPTIPFISGEWSVGEVGPPVLMLPLRTARISLVGTRADNMEGEPARAFLASSFKAFCCSEIAWVLTSSWSSSLVAVSWRLKTLA